MFPNSTRLVRSMYSQSVIWTLVCLTVRHARMHARARAQIVLVLAMVFGLMLSRKALDTLIPVIGTALTGARLLCLRVAVRSVRSASRLVRCLSALAR